jgi:hypothetical protein
LWNENKVTWDYMERFGDYFNPEKIFAKTLVPYKTPGLYTWDVTELVYLWLSDPKRYPNAGLLLKGPEEITLDHSFSFHSKENSIAPELAVDWVLP